MRNLFTCSVLASKRKLELPLAGTNIKCNWFGDRPIHLLGGSPNAQADYAKHLNVVSLDANYAMNLARHGTATWQGQEIKQAGGCYQAFELSLAKQKAYWHKEWRWQDEPLFQLLESMLPQ